MSLAYVLQPNATAAERQGMRRAIDDGLAECLPSMSEAIGRKNTARLLGVLAVATSTYALSSAARTYAPLLVSAFRSSASANDDEGQRPERGQDAAAAPPAPEKAYPLDPADTGRLDRLLRSAREIMRFHGRSWEIMGDRLLRSARQRASTHAKRAAQARERVKKAWERTRGERRS